MTIVLSVQVACCCQIELPEVPTADGATVIAQQIWAIMQASCIAQ